MVPLEPLSRRSGWGGAGAGPGEHGHVVRGVSAGHCAVRRSAASAGDLCYFPVKSSTPVPLHIPARQSCIWGLFVLFPAKSGPLAPPSCQGAPARALRPHPLLSPLRARRSAAQPQGHVPSARRTKALPSLFIYGFGACSR